LAVRHVPSDQPEHLGLATRKPVHLPDCAARVRRHAAKFRNQSVVTTDDS
jgi:hypothetical protein